MKVLTDSDKSGDKITQRSTSGLVVQMGKPCDLFCYAISEVRGSLFRRGGTGGSSSRRLGGHWSTEFFLKQMMFEASLSSWCDSSAAGGILHRAGARRIKFWEVKSLLVYNGRTSHRRGFSK